jgi:hypothetical protein
MVVGVEDEELVVCRYLNSGPDAQETAI